MQLDIYKLELFNLFENGIAIIDADTKVRYWNSWLSNHTKISDAQIVGQEMTDFFPEINKKKLQRKINISLRIQSPSFFFSPDGFFIKIDTGKIADPIFKFMQQSTAIYPIDENLVLVNIMDQTPLRAAEKELNRFHDMENEKLRLSTDSLTGLNSRAKLLEDIAQIEGNKFIALLNLDGFNEINDFYGFEIGDSFLIYVAEQLLAYADAKNMLAYKLPSDEYALLDSNQEQKTGHFIDLIQSFAKHIANHPFLFEESKIPVSFSTGVAVGNEGLMRKADIALKQARQTKQKLFVYDKSLSIEDRYKMNISWLNILNDAMANERIVPYYQPIINNKTNRIEKYEALVRLIDNNGKIISPFFFLDIAKKAKLYSRITHMMVEKSMQTFAHHECEFSINLSVEDILDEGTVEFILSKLYRYPDIARRMVFEIVESEGIENFGEISEFIQEVKAFGAKIAIDDFGTGYSNFFYLTQLELDYLKIDGSLIKTIAEDRHVEMVVEALIELARKLDAKVIAEFVHSQDVLNKVEGMGVDYSQGYYLGEPAPELKAINS